MSFDLPHSVWVTFDAAGSVTGAALSPDAAGAPYVPAAYLHETRAELNLALKEVRILRKQHVEYKERQHEREREALGFLRRQLGEAKRRARDFERGGDRLYGCLARFDRRDLTPLANLVQAAREGWERSHPEMGERTAWDDYERIDAEMERDAREERPECWCRYHGQNPHPWRPAEGIGCCPIGAPVPEAEMNACRPGCGCATSRAKGGSAP